MFVFQVRALRPKQGRFLVHLHLNPGHVRGNRFKDVESYFPTEAIAETLQLKHVRSIAVRLFRLRLHVLQSLVPWILSNRKRRTGDSANKRICREMQIRPLSARRCSRGKKVLLIRQVCRVVWLEQRRQFFYFTRDFIAVNLWLISKRTTENTCPRRNPCFECGNKLFVVFIKSLWTI